MTDIVERLEKAAPDFRLEPKIEGLLLSAAAEIRCLREEYASAMGQASAEIRRLRTERDNLVD